MMGNDGVTDLPFIRTDKPSLNMMGNDGVTDLPFFRTHLPSLKNNGKRRGI